MPSKTPLSLGRKLLFSGIMTLVLLGCVEIGCRIAGFGRGVLLEREEGIGWRLLPNQDRETPNGLPVHVNEFGYRDEDFPREKPAGEFRTLLIGDSVTFGIDVAQDKTFAALLHRRFMASHGPGKVRIINGGTQGYDASQYEFALKRYGFDVSPDLVLVMLFVNDLEIADHPEPFKDFFGRDLLRYTATYEAFSKYYGSKVEVKSGTKEEREQAAKQRAIDQYVGREVIDPTTPIAQKNLILIRAILGRMRDECASRGIAFGVVILPAWAYTKNPAAAQLSRLFERSCQEQDIKYLNLLVPMADRHEELWLPWDVGHFSESGHQIAAQFIGEWLVTTGMVPSPQ